MAYDVPKQTWYDAAASGVRHFPDRRDEALDWTDRLFTFNTTCFNCHVRELSTNYDFATDTYHTTWAEPGINCESCHGPAGEHVQRDGSHPRRPRPKDSRSSAQAAPRPKNERHLRRCHAKLVPLSVSFRPGDKFFDHFDLVTLEHADYYPDGRDLGENYTYTSWLMSPCASRGSWTATTVTRRAAGRGLLGEQAEPACRLATRNGCETRRAQPSSGGSAGDQCIACHMPMTRFAAMGRSDHSMRRPPRPRPSSLQSPNACGPCHADHDAAWADRWVRNGTRTTTRRPFCSGPSWSSTPPATDSGSGFPRCWRRLATNRPTPSTRHRCCACCGGCEDGEAKWPAILEAAKDPSPLVRPSAVAALGDRLTPNAHGRFWPPRPTSSRLVRIVSAMPLARSNRRRRFPTSANGGIWKRAVAEFMTAMHARPDDWASHANLGNFYMERRDSHGRGHFRDRHVV